MEKITKNYLTAKALSKPMLISQFKKHIGLAFLLLFSHTFLLAQDGLSDLQIQVYEDNSIKSKLYKPVEGVEISLYFHGAWIRTDLTSMNGTLRYSTLVSGEYKITWSKIGYFGDSDFVYVRPGINKEYIVSLANFSTIKSDSIIDIHLVRETPPPLIPIGVGPPSLKKEKILERGTDPMTALLKTNPNIIRAGNGTSFRGSRWDANRTFIDGALDNGSGLNTLGTEMIGATVGGVPANKGDFTGGSFDWVTRSAGLKHLVSTEFISSWKLDPYGYLSAAGFASGPLWIKKYKDGNRTKQFLKLGYVFNGQHNFSQDANPTSSGIYILKEESKKRIESNPLAFASSGIVYASSFLTENDFSLVKAHPNSPSQSGNFYGKLEFRPTLHSNLTAFVKYAYNSGLAVTNSIMNYDANPINRGSSFLTYLQYTQTLKTSSNNALQNAFYTIRAEYSNQNSKTMDANHREDIFSYGYLGSFQRFSTPVFTQTSPVHKQIGFLDTLITFTASGKNPVREAYTQNVFDYYHERGFSIRNNNTILNNLGLLNGYNPSSIYSLWDAPGTNNSRFGKTATDRVSIFAQGQFSYVPNPTSSIKRPSHDFQFGIYTEQQTSRGYSLNANGLWLLMSQLANSHISELDLNNPIFSYDANGVFTDTITFNRLINKQEQSNFDRTFRNQLIASGAKDHAGKLIDEQSFLDINSYAPEDFNLNMFSADELLNNGNGYVSYYGYDHLGNRTKENKGIAGFLNKDKRSIDAFKPIYTAAWIQDQFRFKDLVFRLGLRMERYDANQNVQADLWSQFPIKTAGEVTELNGVNISHPNNIGSDYKVYVNDIISPSKIVGYRNEGKWYNSDGTVQSSPDFIANQTTNGRIAPFLVNPSQNIISSASFKDFKPTINLLPRLWFSFPLVPDRQTFYVSYDVLAQRPNSSASFLSMDESYYLKNRQGSTISNGQLGARIRTNYEAGYKLIFGKKLNKGLELSVSNSEVRKDFGLYQINQAFPVTYITYRNIDFSTITGFQSSFVMNDIGPLSIYIGYMLQFADGTGSNINSQAALIASNQPNLRTVIPMGELDVRHNIKANATWVWLGGYDKRSNKNLYSGPIIGNIEVLKNTTLNITFNTYSGLPYTPTINPVQLGTTNRAQVKGVPFGARMPWQKFVDINVMKNIFIQKGNANSILQFFLSIQNVFGTKNIVSVFPYTGRASDDGFLNSAQGKSAAEAQLSAQAFTDMYRMMLNSQNGFFGSPRLTRFGLRVFFN